MFIEIVAANRDIDRAGVVGQEPRRLPGRVASADYDRLRPATHLGLGRRSGVIDAAPFVALAALHFQHPVLRPGGDEQTLRSHRLIAVQPNDDGRPVEREAQSLYADRQDGSELVRLDKGVLDQLAPGDPDRKSEDSSRSAYSARPARRGRSSPGRRYSGPRTRHTRRPPARPGLPPTTTRSYTFGSSFRRRPSVTASCRLHGFFRIAFRPKATTGVSASVSPNCRSKSFTSGSASRSSQVCRTPLRVRKSPPERRPARSVSRPLEVP